MSDWNWKNTYNHMCIHELKAGAVTKRTFYCCGPGKSEPVNPVPQPVNEEDEKYTS